MSKKNQIDSLRHKLRSLFASIGAGFDLHFIRNYEEYIDKLEAFMGTYGPHTLEHEKFKAVQQKVEALINSPDISSVIKESLRLKFDRANEVAVNFSMVSASSFNWMSSLIFFLT